MWRAIPFTERNRNVSRSGCVFKLYIDERASAQSPMAKVWGKSKVKNKDSPDSTVIDSKDIPIPVMHA